MRQRAASNVMTALSLVFLALSQVGQASAMSFGKHHSHGGGSTPGAGGNAGSSSASTLSFINAQPYMTPVPEPSTVVLLASGVVALGLWRLKKETRKIELRGLDDGKQEQ